MLTVFKVFFVDMSDLTGIYRALSFIGLGAGADGDRLVLSTAAVSEERRRQNLRSRALEQFARIEDAVRVERRLDLAHQLELERRCLA